MRGLPDCQKSVFLERGHPEIAIVSAQLCPLWEVRR